MDEAKEMLAQIKLALMKEEQAIPLYVDHLEADAFLATLSEDKQIKIKELMGILAHDSAGHVELFKELERIYQEKLKQDYVA